MTVARPYTFTVLRYVHDVVSGEFINVGVLVHEPDSGRVLFRVRSSMGPRLRGLFPDLDREAFSRAMKAIDRSLMSVVKECSEKTLFRDSVDAAAIISRALPNDESCIQWSMPAGSGLTEDLERTLMRLFGRFVARYDVRSIRRRSDEDVWRPVRQMLDDHHLGSHLQEKIIVGAVDEIVFKHAWKNGMWHVYEPLSFDLADADGIKTKAREWAGHLFSVAEGASEVFKPHFIVGAPTQTELNPAYRSALAILAKAPGSPEIFEESEIDELISQIEDEVRAHERESRPK